MVRHAAGLGRWKVWRPAAFLAAAFVALASAPAAQVAPALRAGAARVDITPDAPVALEGYQDPENRISEGVHDRLYARTLALASGRKRLVLVSCDLTSFMFGPYFRRAILDRFNLQPDELFLCATHTHSGPQLSLNRDYPHPNNLTYTRTLESRLLDVVASALSRLSPARLEVGRGSSAVGASRRKPGADGRIEMAYNPDAAADRDLLVLQLARPGDRQVFARLFNYASHSRSLRAPNRLVSGDIFGIAEQAVERTGPRDMLAAAFAGASGDIDPVVVTDGFAAPDGALPPTVRLGHQLADDVLKAFATCRAVPAGAIRTSARRAMLPPKSPGMLKPVEVAVAAVGDVGFVGLDVEASVEIGLALKAASPFKDTFVFTHCNGWAGYLPVAHQYAEGGYEVAHTGFGAAAADLLVKDALSMLAALKAGATPDRSSRGR